MAKAGWFELEVRMLPPLDDAAAVQRRGRGSGRVVTPGAGSVIAEEASSPQPLLASDEGSEVRAGEAAQEGASMGFWLLTADDCGEVRGGGDRMRRVLVDAAPAPVGGGEPGELEVAGELAWRQDAAWNMLLGRKDDGRSPHAHGVARHLAH
jgi:hypothetical protein